MLPDRVSNPGPLTYESGALPIALRGPALFHQMWKRQRILVQGNCSLRHENWNFKTQDKINFLTLFEVIFF